MASLEQVKNNLDIVTVNRTVDLLTQAKNIPFGFGISTVVAHNMMNKFFRFNILVMCLEDIVLQLINCMNSNKSDIIVLISHICNTKILITPSALTRESDAMIIAIISPYLPLVLETLLTMVLDILEYTNMFISITLRMYNS